MTEPSRPRSSAAVLDVLHHRGLVRADALGAGDPLFDAETQTDAERSPTAALPVIAAASARVGAKQQMSSSVAWLSALTGLKVTLPQSFIQISARTSASAGDLKPALVKSSDSARYARSFAIDFGDRQAMAFDMPDDSRALDLRRLVADRGDDGVNRQMASDHTARIDALEPNAFVRAAMLKEIPPGHAVCVVTSVVEGVTIEATSAAIGVSLCALTPRTTRSAPPASSMRSVASTRATISSPFSLLLKLVFANCLQAPPARHDGHASAGRGYFRGNVAADRACADDCDVHPAIRTHPSANNVDLQTLLSYHNEARACAQGSGRRNCGLPQAVLRQIG